MATIGALDLLAHLGDAQLDRLAGLADGRDATPFAGLLAAAGEHGVEDVVARARSHGLGV
jgi:hypothetical protein